MRILRHTVVLAALVVAIGATAVLRAPSVRAEGTASNATFEGVVGCDLKPDGTPGECKRWSWPSPPGAHEWSKADNKSVAGPAPASASGHITYAEQYDSAGRFHSLTLTVHLEASLNGGGGKADAYFTYDLQFEPATSELHVHGGMDTTGTGTETVGAFTEAETKINCGEDSLEATAQASAGGGHPNSNSDSVPLSAVVESDEGGCHIQIDGHTGMGGNRLNPGDSGRSSVDVTVTITAAGSPPPCVGLRGTVLDGTPPIGHHNPLPGVRVQLYRGSSSVGEPVATAADGTYCISTSTTVQPDDYTARATLIDQRHDPALFEVRQFGRDRAAYSEVPVTVADFTTNQALDIPFTDSAEAPHQSDLANIYWQSNRFVEWVLKTVPPATFGRVVIVAFDTEKTYSYYTADMSPPEAHISAAPKGLGEPGVSTYAARNGPRDNGPENAEWHEIAHHVARVLHIADINGSACAGRIAHGGWLNDSTCDSVGEGFAVYLAAYASLFIDLLGEDVNGVPGYGTPYYAQFLDLETSEMRPWTLFTPNSGPQQGREDFAVAQLLWDLTDDTPDEQGLVIRASDPTLTQAAASAGGGNIDLPGHDSVAIPVEDLMRILAASPPQTVVELLDALRLDAELPSELNVRSIDLDGDGTADITPLEEAFLVQGFHPINLQADPRFALGDNVGYTNRATFVSNGLVERLTIEEIPGSRLRLRNGTDADQTFTVVIKSAGDRTVSWTAVVPAHSSQLEYLELPPYFEAALKPGEALPACGAANADGPSITVSAAGEPPMQIDGCAYWHAVQASTDGSAATYSVGSGPFGSDGTPGSSSSPGSPTTNAPGIDISAPMLAIGGALALAVALAIVFLLRRRRGASPMRPPFV